MKKLGLYVHIPFCVQKCAYCDFLSAPSKAADRISYIQALKKEIKSFAAAAKDYEVDTVFFGGGTPSILEPELIRELMECLKESFCFIKEDAESKLEITLEANPGTLTKEKLISYRKSGINRLSMGLQSADKEELRLLGRIHTFEQFKENYKAAREAGFENISVDLMSALPGQTLKSYQTTLEKVLALEPEHISAYSLIIEEGTPFYTAWEEGKLILPEEEEERQMYYLTEELLKKAGYDRYEISNYAKKRYESRHNSKYWTGEEYLGLGLGAASYWKGSRNRNTENLADYLEKANAGESLLIESLLLTKQEKIEEFMFLGLRRMEGVSKEVFRERFGEELLSVYGEIIKEQETKGLIAQDEKRLWLTAQGIDLSNQVMAEYLF